MESNGAQRAFWLHLVDNLFGHRLLFLVPVILFTAFGANQAAGDVPLYESISVVRVDTNPYVGLQVVRGTDYEYRETPAEGTVRLIEEQFGSDRFASEVTEQAGLGDAIGAGWGVLGVVRDSIELEAQGNSLITVTATWGDPVTSLALVEGLIGAYEAYLAETASTDAANAEAFFRTVLDDALSDAVAHERDLADYVNALPPLLPGAQLGLSEELELGRLESRLERAREAVSEAQAHVDEAVFANDLATQENARLIETVDAAVLAAAPLSTVTQDVQVVIAHFVMGLVVAFAALLVTTTVDRVVTVPSEIAAFGVVGVVPPIGTARYRNRRWSIAPQRQRG